MIRPEVPHDCDFGSACNELQVAAEYFELVKVARLFGAADRSATPSRRPNLHPAECCRSRPAKTPHTEQPLLKVSGTPGLAEIAHLVGSTARQPKSRERYATCHNVIPALCVPGNSPEHQNNTEPHKGCADNMPGHSPLHSHKAVVQDRRDRTSTILPSRHKPAR